MRARRKEMQIIFQDPDSSFNPRMTAYEHIKIALETHNLLDPKRKLEQVHSLLELVHLPAHLGSRYPFELSGGQKQRLSLARALSVEPELLVLDEPLASLDVSVRAQIIQLLQELKNKKNLSYLFITHDISTIKQLADHVAVLYLGSLVEFAPLDSILTPLHPYTEALFSAAPIPDPIQERKRTRIVLPGDPPSLISPPPGCPFQTRCPHAKAICRRVAPPLREERKGHFVACHLYS
jgi:oligopeptide transport system ATP-binding protein